MKTIWFCSLNGDSSVPSEAGLALPVKGGRCGRPVSL